MLILGMVVLSVLALAVLGLGIYEAVTHHRGHPSPRLNWIRPLIGPIAILILALVGIKTLNNRRRALACKRPG